jgi:hypothetical protein
MTVAASALALVCSYARSTNAGAVLLDVGGNWTGTIVCKGISEGVKDTFTLDPVMRIAQSGIHLGIVLDYGGGTTEQYAAILNPDAKKGDAKGEAAIIYCGTDDQIGLPPDFDEIGRMSLSAKPGKVKASFKGLTIFSDYDTPGPFRAGYTCKYKNTRIDTNPPGISTQCQNYIPKPPPVAP